MASAGKFVGAVIEIILGSGGLPTPCTVLSVHGVQERFIEAGRRRGFPRNLTFI
jgi:hypothetical protein